MDRPLPRPPLRRRVLRRSLWLFGLYLLVMPVVAVVSGSLAVQLEGGESYGSWREARAASTASAGLAPEPAQFRQAVVQVYAARAWGFKKAFAVHSWIAVKPADAAAYEVYEVIGWRRNRGLSVVSRDTRVPDLPWYGSVPTLLLDLRGAEAGALIDRVKQATAAYPWADEYTAWPGPNSNTFVAWIGRQVPELGLDLPSTAIGKDYLPLADAFGPSVSGSGYQASLLGLASVSLGSQEGLEINLLGLNLELDLLDLAVELPGFGRIGPDPADGG